MDGNRTRVTDARREGLSTAPTILPKSIRPSPCDLIEFKVGCCQKASFVPCTCFRNNAQGKANNTDHDNNSPFSLYRNKMHGYGTKSHSISVLFGPFFLNLLESEKTNLGKTCHDHLSAQKSFLHKMSSPDERIPLNNKFHFKS